MAAFLYELIMTAVLALGAMSSVCFLSGMEEIGAEYYLCTALITSVLVLAGKLKTRGRLILAGVCGSGLAGIILSVPQEERRPPFPAKECSSGGGCCWPHSSHGFCISTRGS